MVTRYLLFNRATGETAIWYMNGGTLIKHLAGPTVPEGFLPVSAADFDGDGQPISCWSITPRARRWCGT